MKTHFNSPKGCKRLMGLLLAANNQATRRNEIIIMFNDTVGFPSVSKVNPVVFGGRFCLWLRPPFFVCFAVSPAGETHIWPGDMRRRCWFWFLFGV